MLKNFMKTIIDPFPMVALVYRNLRDQLDRRRPAIEFNLTGH